MPLWGRKTLEIFSNQALDSLPKKPTHLQRNSIKSFFYDSLVYCNTPHILTQHTFTGMPMIKFQRALILEEGWKMTMDIGQPWHFPSGAEYKHDASAIRAAEMAFSFASAVQMWQTWR